MCPWVQVPMEAKEGVGSPGIGVRGSWEPRGLGVGNQAGIFWKSGAHSVTTEAFRRVGKISVQAEFCLCARERIGACYCVCNVSGVGTCLWVCLRPEDFGYTCLYYLTPLWYVLSLNLKMGWQPTSKSQGSSCPHPSIELRLQIPIHTFLCWAFYMGIRIWVQILT